MIFTYFYLSISRSNQLVPVRSNDTFCPSEFHCYRNVIVLKQMCFLMWTDIVFGPKKIGSNIVLLIFTNLMPKFTLIWCLNRDLFAVLITLFKIVSNANVKLNHSKSAKDQHCCSGVTSFDFPTQCTERYIDFSLSIT